MTPARAFDPQVVAKDFPILQPRADGSRLIYLDSAATAQKPTSVIEALGDVYRTNYANVHRGVYRLAEEATAAFEHTRSHLARFLGAREAAELVFTRNATEAVNLVAHGWGRHVLREGDVIVLTMMEHHANIVPWQMLAAERGIELRWIPLTDDYRLDLTDLEEFLDGAKLLAFSAMSNVLGTMQPIRRLVDAAHAAGALALVDACQWWPHMPTSLIDWDADFAVGSAHKMMGPGVGALYAKRELLEMMRPFLGGGEMIRDVRLDGFTTNDVPWKFEAGTPPVAETIAWSAALDYLEALGMDAVAAHEQKLTTYALSALDRTFGERLRILGPPAGADRGGLISFELAGIHPHDIAQILDEREVCVRAGHHCAKPLMRLLGVSATARASVGPYTTASDIDALVDGLLAAEKFFQPPKL
ncbi:MAG: SufS family cysteine desulfurase [Acidimicrobiia bacterium]